MGRLSRHAVNAPHRAPVREATSHLALKAYATFVVFSALAHSWWYNLLGTWGAEILIVVIVIATLAIWIPSLARRTVPYPWRRLPWAALGYVALALVSTAWSSWPTTSAITATVLAGFTLQALFLADMLSWSELMRCLEVALRWVVAGSLAFEAWVALVVRHPILPNFFPASGEPDPHWYWVRGNLFDAWLIGDRIQGIVGNSNLLGMLLVLALIVFSARLRSGVLYRLPVERIVTRAVWLAVTAWLLVRAGSATSFVAIAVVVGVLVIALVMRGRVTPRGRANVYAVVGAFTLMGGVIVAFGYGRIAGLLGRDGGMTGRDAIWRQVGERASERPIEGHGFASPWLPWDPAFSGWIEDHGLTVFSAHNMWLDVLLQLGWIGVAVAAVVFGTAVWRAWFFAIDRPRWDQHADRPYSPLALVPLLAFWALLVQGVAESNPIMLWGWMLVVMFSAKIKRAPALTHPETRPREGPPA